MIHTKYNRAAPSPASSETAPASVRTKKGDGAAAGEEYDIKRGDTLSHIAQAAYGNAALWPAIKAMNERKVRGNDMIFTGDKVTLPTLAEAQAKMQQLGFDANGKKAGWPPKNNANTGNRAAGTRQSPAASKGGPAAGSAAEVEATALVAKNKGSLDVVAAELSRALGTDKLDLATAIIHEVKKAGLAEPFIKEVEKAEAFVKANADKIQMLGSTDEATLKKGVEWTKTIDPKQGVTMALGLKAAQTKSMLRAPLEQSGAAQPPPIDRSVQIRNDLAAIKGDAAKLAEYAAKGGAVEAFAVTAASALPLEALDKAGAGNKNLELAISVQRGLIDAQTDPVKIAKLALSDTLRTSGNAEAATNLGKAGDLSDAANLAMQTVGNYVVSQKVDSKLVTKAMSDALSAMPGKEDGQLVQAGTTTGERKKRLEMLKPEERAAAAAFIDAIKRAGALNLAMIVVNVAGAEVGAPVVVPEAVTTVSDRRNAAKSAGETKGDVVKLVGLALQGDPATMFAAAQQALSHKVTDQMLARLGAGMAPDKALYDSVAALPPEKRADKMDSLDEDQKDSVERYLQAENAIYALKQTKFLFDSNGDLKKIAAHVLSAGFDDPLNLGQTKNEALRAVAQDLKARNIDPAKLVEALTAQFHAMAGYKQAAEIEPKIAALRAENGPEAANKIAELQKQIPNVDAIMAASARFSAAEMSLTASATISKAKGDPDTVLGLLANFGLSGQRPLLDAIAEEAMKSPGLAKALLDRSAAITAAAKPLIEQHNALPPEQREAFARGLDQTQQTLLELGLAAPALTAHLTSLSGVEKATDAKELATAVASSREDARVATILAAAEKAQGSGALVKLGAEAAALQQKLIAANPGLEEKAREFGAVDPTSAKAAERKKLPPSLINAIDDYTSLSMVRLRANDAIVEETQKKLGVPDATTTVAAGKTLEQTVEAALRKSLGSGDAKIFEYNYKNDDGQKGVKQLASTVESLRTPGKAQQNIGWLVGELAPKGSVTELVVPAVPWGDERAMNVLLKVSLPSGDVAHYALVTPETAVTSLLTNGTKSALAVAFQKAWKDAGNDPQALISNFNVPADATQDQMLKTIMQLKANDAKANPPTKFYADYLKRSAVKVTLPTLDSKPERLSVQLSQQLATNTALVKKVCRGILPSSVIADPIKMREAVKALSPDLLNTLVTRWTNETGAEPIASVRIDPLIAGTTKDVSVTTNVRALNAGRLEGEMKKPGIGLTAVGAQFTSEMLSGGNEPKTIDISKDRVELINEVGQGLAVTSDKYSKWLSEQIGYRTNEMPYQEKAPFEAYDGDDLLKVKKVTDQIALLTAKRKPGAKAEVQTIHLSVVGKNDGANPIPLFKVKTMVDGKQVTKFVDSQGSVFDSFAAFKAENSFAGMTVFAPKDGEVKAGADGQVIAEMFDGGGTGNWREAVNFTEKHLGSVQYGVMGASASQLVRPSTRRLAMMEGLVGTALMPVGMAMLAVGVVDTVYRAYEMGSHSETPWETLKDVRDPAVRQLWLGAVGSGLQLAGMGAMMRAGRVGATAGLSRAPAGARLASAELAGAAPTRAATVSSVRQAARASMTQVVRTNVWAATANRLGIGIGIAGGGDAYYQYKQGLNTLDADTLTQLKQGVLMSLGGTALGLTSRGSARNFADVARQHQARKTSFVNKVKVASGSAMTQPATRTAEAEALFAKVNLNEWGLNAHALKANAAGLVPYNKQVAATYMAALDGAPVNLTVMHEQLRRAVAKDSQHLIPELMNLLPKQRPNAVKAPVMANQSVARGKPRVAANDESVAPPALTVVPNTSAAPKPVAVAQQAAHPAAAGPVPVQVTAVPRSALDSALAQLSAPDSRELAKGSSELRALKASLEKAGFTVQEMPLLLSVKVVVNGRVIATEIPLKNVNAARVKGDLEELFKALHQGRPSAQHPSVSPQGSPRGPRRDAQPADVEP